MSGFKTAACLAVLLGAGQSLADTVTLKDGREMHGRLVRETEDRIWLRTNSQGETEIPKSRIATFTENANWGRDYELRTEGARPSTEEGGEGAGEGGDEGDAGTPAAGGGAGGATKTEDGGLPGDLPQLADWTWPDELSQAEVKVREGLRDKFYAELTEELLPTTEERLEKIQLPPDADEELERLSAKLAWKRRQGSANMQRRNALNDLLGTYGVAAIPTLVDNLGHEDWWRQRLSATGLGDLMKAGSASDGLEWTADEARWYAYHFNAPASLLGLLDHKENTLDSPFIRQEANQALAAITEHKVNYPPVDEKPTLLPSAAESDAIRRWKSWWPIERKRWVEAEKARDERREKVVAALQDLLKGKIPELKPKGE
ncbi:MAG: hypothetical protein R3F62_17540 [Planctomycetota bacterium]